MCIHYVVLQYLILLSPILYLYGLRLNEKVAKEAWETDTIGVKVILLFDAGFATAVITPFVKVHVVVV